MRYTLLLGAISFATTFMVAADNIQPLKVKPGLWQVTTTTTIEGMGASETRTYTSCVTKENANGYPFADRQDECKYTVQSSTGSHMEVSGNCLYEGARKAEFKIQLDVVDPEDVQGSGHLNLAAPQATMHGSYTGAGKWIADSCPAGMK